MATAAPDSRGFGPAIDEVPDYDGQSMCDPSSKPGVVAFQRIVLASYPGTGVGGIGRDCAIGGQSEHKEGRAWDWSVSAAVPYQKASAESLLEWLTDEDRYGNEAAMARRLGLMYMIWNRKIWFPWGGWETYCVQKSFGCHAPGEPDSLRQTHTDHVHFSFGWDGAEKKTTYWNKDRSLLSAVAASPTGSGHWVVGRNGGVSAVGADFFGSKADRPLRQPIVDIAATPDGYGYWLVSKDGRVSAFGSARFRGGAKGQSSHITAMTPTPTGKGYWLATTGGSVFAFGDAHSLGGYGDSAAPVVDIAATATGLGYWLLAADGTVKAVGDAQSFGSLETDRAAGIESTPTGLGYLVVTGTGNVAGFGDAAVVGDHAGKSFDQNITRIASTPTRHGYWLVGDRGKVASFGDAPRATRVASLARMVPPSGLRPAQMPAD